MVLEGKRILLRRFKNEDVKEYFKIATDESMKKYLPYASPDDLEECIELIENYSNLDFINDFYLIIEDKDSHQMIGAILSFRTSALELDTSYFIGKDFRGNGFVIEALQVFIDYLSKNCIYKTLFFMIKNDNLPSTKIMEKLGATKIQNIGTSSSYQYQIKSAN